ncbi:MAG TPA: hypothetical protein VLE97_06075 [Gaiellaceae bacterium]|nr:hypothetical protein [Gaiellaceae bacterium]
MTSTIVDQPPLRATDRRPSWDIVMSYVDQLRRDNAHVVMGVSDCVLSLVLSDMRARDAVGRERYGTPLTSGNGRDHLVDAYQEYLDACVYLMNELDEHGVALDTRLTEEAFPDQATRWHLHDVQQLCISQIRASIHLRAIIEGRGQTTVRQERAS